MIGYYRALGNNTLYLNIRKNTIKNKDLTKQEGVIQHNAIYFTKNFKDNFISFFQDYISKAMYENYK